MTSKLTTWLLLASAAVRAQDAAADGQKPLLHWPRVIQHHDEPSPLPVAKIALYPGSRIHPEDLKSLGLDMPPPCSSHSGGDDAETVVEIDLAVGTCLSGDYYLRDNLEIKRAPVCGDGSNTKAKVEYYRVRGCKGEPAITREVYEGEEKKKNACLWGEKDEGARLSYYWSMVIRCPDEGDTVLGHRDATPKILHQSNGVGGGGVVKGDVQYVTGSSCKDGERGFGAWSNGPDDCSWPYTTFGFHSIRITNPLICPNGTRARIARYEDTRKSDRTYKCNGGKMTLVDGLMDVNDDDLGKCISVRGLSLLRGGTANAKGIMWYCDGFPSLDNTDDHGNAAPPPKQDSKNLNPNALVSHNACEINTYSYGQNSGAAEERPTTWMEVPLDKCMNLFNGRPLRALRTPVCPDGKEAMLAKWSTSNCPGMPDSVAGFQAGLGEVCRTFHGRDGSGSYEFWCDVKDPEGKQRRLKRPADDKRAIYSKDTCKPKDGWWTPERHQGLAATIERVEVGECVGSFGSGKEWVVHANAVCKDGKTKAKVAYWKGEGRCRGKPDEIVDVREEDLGRCVKACEENEKWSYKCSRAFWCEGF
ncbi:hypothetical protein QBC43DRAFT_374728 [Cladorrhinum sp. PSN259]|nr:hypothetical protein QBC43DRAFT_374728 [Cladorrhinum sp. PSN259]